MYYHEQQRENGRVTFLSSVCKFRGSMCLCLFDQEHISLQLVLGCRGAIDRILDFCPSQKVIVMENVPL